MKKIIIFWRGLPACSALIQDLASSPDFDVTLFYTPPSVPFKGIEKYLSGVSSFNKIVNYKDLPDPIFISKFDCVVTTGWYSAHWNKLLVRSKKLNPDLKIVCAIDNIFADTILGIGKQILGFFYYRLKFRGLFDYCFVPGARSFNFMKFLGHNTSKILHGYYGATSQIYFPRSNFCQRSSGFIFVGQIIDRKGVRLLLDAYLIYKKSGGTYKLTLIGSTNETLERTRFNIGDNPNIKFLPFMQPSDVAEIMSDSKVFILPSYRDHWGTVLCEAAACGCLLIASHQSGSSTDLIRSGVNGFTFDSKERHAAEQLASLMVKIETISSLPTADARSKVSMSLASNYNQSIYSLALQTIFL